MPRGEPGIHAGNDPTAALFSSLTDDEEVKALVKQVAMRALHEADRVLQSGTPALKMSVGRSIIPALIKTLRQNTDDEIADLRAQMQSLMSEVRESTPTRISVHRDPTVDEPPPPGTTALRRR